MMLKMKNQTTQKIKKRKQKSFEEIVSKGIYENGFIKLSGKKLPKKRMKVLVTFREAEDEATKSNEKTVENFIKKWSGAIKEQNIQMVMERKLEYLVEKHK